jgi:tRNA A-37 threonylcarbamoyl transferase component Bud32
VLRIVGQGGMGAVYLARQKALDRVVAIKLIRTAHEDDPTFAARFAREARAMAKLSHPNIVAVHDTGEAGGLPFLVMEYVDGVTLRDAIRTKAVTPAEALAIIPQICDALEYAHKHGVVHRDIKPENILLDANGRVKIADFGLAKLADPDSMSLTGTMQAMGTPHYMAPEQWEKPAEVDHRADIYALGVVLYELLTGELPLGRFDPPSVKSRVDARIDELVLRALAKEPGRRYQHATDVKLALAKIAASPGWVPRSGFEYKSKATLLGWPLVHVAARRDPAHGYPTVAKGWIAVGTGTAIGGIAVGGSGALGGIALAGGGAVGVFALGGGCAIGLLALAGGWAAGGVAVGGGAGIGAYLGVGGGFAFGGNYAVAGGGAYAPVASSGESPNPHFWPQLRDAVSVIWQSVGGLFRR